jgi:hypothetical protein
VKPESVTSQWIAAVDRKTRFRSSVELSDPLRVTIDAIEHVALSYFLSFGRGIFYLPAVLLYSVLMDA